jgi:hypothetical protein
MFEGHQLGSRHVGRLLTKVATLVQAAPGLAGVVACRTAANVLREREGLSGEV